MGTCYVQTLGVRQNIVPDLMGQSEIKLMSPSCQGCQLTVKIPIEFTVICVCAGETNFDRLHVCRECRYILTWLTHVGIGFVFGLQQVSACTLYLTDRMPPGN